MQVKFDSHSGHTPFPHYTDLPPAPESLFSKRAEVGCHLARLPLWWQEREAVRTFTCYY